MNFLHHSFKTTTGEAESELDTYSPFQKSSTDTTRFVRVVKHSQLAIRRLRRLLTCEASELSVATVSSLRILFYFFFLRVEKLENIYQKPIFQVEILF